MMSKYEHHVGVVSVLPVMVITIDFIATAPT
jgi:hypothetical protein